MNNKLLIIALLFFSATAGAKEQMHGKDFSITYEKIDKDNGALLKDIEVMHNNFSGHGKFTSKKKYDVGEYALRTSDSEVEFSASLSNKNENIELSLTLDNDFYERWDESKIDLENAFNIVKGVKYGVLTLTNSNVFRDALIGLTKNQNFPETYSKVQIIKTGSDIVVPRAIFAIKEHLVVYFSGGVRLEFDKAKKVNFAFSKISDLDIKWKKTEKFDQMIIGIDQKIPYIDLNWLLTLTNEREGTFEIKAMPLIDAIEKLKK